SRNAMITDRMVRIVRVFLRNRLAMTNPVLVMTVPLAIARGAPSGGGLLEQLPLFQMQYASGKLRGLRIVGHHDDRLAVLAIQHLQQTENLISRLAIEIARGLIAYQQLGIRHQGACDRDALLL